MLDSVLLALSLSVPVGAAPAALPAPVPAPAASPTAVSLRTAEIEIDAVQLVASDETKLEATFYRPKGEERAPAALLLHAAGQDSSSLTDLAERMWKDGYAVMTLDLRGHGASATEEDVPFAELDKEAQEKLWAYATRDVEAAARWLRTNRLVHSSSLHIVGVGEASALAVRQAARDENVRTVTLIAPAAEMLGFDIAADILGLEGVPTYFFASKASEERVRNLMEVTHEELAGTPFIDLSVLRSKDDAELIADKKLPSTLTKALRSHAFPTRGAKK